MHLPSGDKTLHLGGVSGMSDMGIHSNGISKPQQNGSHTNGSNGTNGHSSQVNELQIPRPRGEELSGTLDTILTAWTILIHRYQRDAFQQFTWGIKAGEKDGKAQCIQTADFDLPSQKTADSLKAKLGSTRTADLALAQGSTLFLNDGTSSEWTFEVSLDISESSIHAATRWLPPTMSQYQAVSQLQSFGHILETLLNEPNHDISDLVSISQRELEEIWKWNYPEPEERKVCHHDMISEKAAQFPDKIAIDAWDGTLTYKQLEDYSTSLAQNLRLINDSADQVIPVLFEKSRWTAVAVLAVLKAGACFALLDPAQPEGRLRSITQQLNPSLLICAKSQASLAAQISPSSTIIPISESKFDKVYSPTAEQQPKTSLPKVSPSANMYIQFTSGSTGLPKGCLVSHSQYTTGAIPRGWHVGYREHSRVFDFASYAFDVSIDTMFCTLAIGATLCTPSEERRMNDLSGVMRDLRVTLAGMTPSVARTLDTDVLDKLESLGLGGEGLTPNDAISFGRRTRVVNAYGPSECTVGATVNPNVNTKPYITMGRGAGCALWLTEPNNHNKLVPIGAVGELLIEGPIVGNGYLSNPEKTKEVFIEAPEFLIQGSRSFPGRHGRVYRTGDLCRFDPDGDGEVMFVGRGDQQVKLRGQRIELAEIEHNMQKHLPSECQLAVEVIKPGGIGEATLVAFLVEDMKNGMRHLEGTVFGNFSEKFHATLQKMTKQLFKDLPGYMVPIAYIPLWKMPLLISYKTDRKRLREIGSSITRQDLRRFNSTVAEKKELATETEIKLAAVWAKLLGGDTDFSANDNFFSMGGDSLRAMRLVANARKEGMVLSVPDVLLNPTLSAMAAKATLLSEEEANEVAPFSLIGEDWDAEQARTESAQLCNVDVSMVEDVYPCTPLQEGLMALSFKFSDAYIAQRVATLPREEARQLKKAFETAVKGTPIWRTRIVNVPGRGLFQVVLKDWNAFREHGSDLATYLKNERLEAMDLGKALFRYGLVEEEGADTAHVVITSHHAIYDGWSMPLVLERTERALKGLDTIRPASFRHFIKYLLKHNPSISRDWWKQHMEGVSPHQFPPLPHKGYITQANALLDQDIAAPTSAHSRHTLATIIRGAWSLLSSLYMGHSDIVFGETLTGRSAPIHGVEQIEGPMITTIPVRVRVGLDQSVNDYLQMIHTLSVQQIPHEHLGLQNIRRVSKDARAACDLRTGFVLQPKVVDDWSSNAYENSLLARFMPANEGEAAREALKFNTYGIMLICTLDKNGFNAMTSFDTNCISIPAMQRVLDLFDRIVTAFLSSPEAKLADLAVLTPEEEEDARQMRPADIMTDSGVAMAPVESASVDAPTSCTALSANEEKLRSLLARILSMPETEISPSDSFFELGGDSIGAMRLVSDARAQGFSISVAQVFQSKSLADLAKFFGNDKEEKLIDMLSRILGMPRSEIKANDSFFELGGDSIGAMRLVSDARSQGLEITVAQVFRSKSLAELAASAQQAQSSQSQVLDTPYLALGKEASLYSADRICSYLENPEWDIVNIYPLRPLQQLAVEGTVALPRYSLRYELIKFTTPIDEQRLHDACQELVARNEVLRTVFVLDGSKNLGVVLSSLQVPYSQVTVPDGIDINSFAQGYVHSDILAPKPHGTSFVGFTLFVSPSTGASTLAFRISHAQYDEMCLPTLFDQLSALYCGSEVPVMDPYTKHVNHVVLNNIPVSIPYWQELLDGSKMSVMKPDIPLVQRKMTDTYMEFDISSRPKGITIGSLPTAAWALVLARRLATKDVVFGEVVNGRSLGLPNADRIYGPTWQYVPFRVPFKSTWTYLDLLKFVQLQHVESSSYEGMGFAEIVENCTNWDPKETTWFDTVVHQAPAWVEELPFGDDVDGNKVEAKFETMYPHPEPLREWKCQAFVRDGGKKLGIEIVTFEEWIGVGKEVLKEVGEALSMLMNGNAGNRIFEEEVAEAPKQTLEDFEGVM
ncbi:hypothetical protein HBH70_187070 [Parastagonospora nodorum]|nr:hypothetical protein HBH51_210770 [Parastagonospora nodorum]KAH3960353.1 hypothetical protein HBH52_238070 [Parastagonospora nodorum]KAH4014849.1 hypothetical protein HBI09_209520 [Parastagonospora nodorum]KAH4097294.1 hypothetical protein HBH46_162550 [Parastagonospora nodorum]KAH4114994.1 hypothetical protein HBH47_187040 [Parastagonospora nodorum]